MSKKAGRMKCTGGKSVCRCRVDSLQFKTIFLFIYGSPDESFSCRIGRCTKVNPFWHAMMTLWVLAPLFFYCLKLRLSISEYQPQLEYSNAPLACGGIGFEDEFEAGEGGAPVQVGGGVRLPQRYKLIGNIGAPVSPTPPSFGTFR